MQEDERLEEERREEEKASAIETMENWFHENFEDPQNQMPWDNEDQKYIYPYGGPYEPQDILHDTFKTEFDAAWIVEAAERITDAGTFEWAPSSNSEYYEHPDPDDDDDASLSPQATQLKSEILDQLAELKELVASLPAAKFGHNGPPDEIGLPPYGEEEADEIDAAIAETQAILGEPVPDPTELNRQSGKLQAAATKLGKWIAGKLDLATDELIKNTIKAWSWASALGLLGAAATGLKNLALMIIGG